MSEEKDIVIRPGKQEQKDKDEKEEKYHQLTPSIAYQMIRNALRQIEEMTTYSGYVDDIKQYRTLDKKSCRRILNTNLGYPTGDDIRYVDDEKKRFQPSTLATSIKKYDNMYQTLWRESRSDVLFDDPHLKIMLKALYPEYYRVFNTGLIKINTYDNKVYVTFDNNINSNYSLSDLNKAPHIFDHWAQRMAADTMKRIGDKYNRKVIPGRLVINLISPTSNYCHANNYYIESGQDMVRLYIYEPNKNMFEGSNLAYNIILAYAKKLAKRLGKKMLLYSGSVILIITLCRRILILTI